MPMCEGVPVLDVCGAVADERQPPPLDRLCLLGGVGARPTRRARRGRQPQLQDEGSGDLMAWLQNISPAEELKRLQRNAPQPTLEQVFEASRRSGVCVYDSLDDIPDAELEER
eukprot:6419368-Alexandrium_andersonii.AAC.1